MTHNILPIDMSRCGTRPILTVAAALLRSPDGRHYVDTREACGYNALEKRITGSHEKNVRDGGRRLSLPLLHCALAIEQKPMCFF